MAAPSPLLRLHKKQTTRADRMIVVTIINIWLKSYLSFVKWVADKMRSIYPLAEAIANICSRLLKKYKNYKSNFSISTEVTCWVSSSSVKIHFTLSPLDNSSLSTISLGIVTLNEPEWEAA